MNGRLSAHLLALPQLLELVRHWRFDATRGGLRNVPLRVFSRITVKTETCDLTIRGSDLVVAIADRLTNGWSPDQLRRSLRWAGERYNLPRADTFMEAPEFFGLFLRSFCPRQDFTEPDRWEIDQQLVAAAKVAPDYPDYSNI